MKTKSFVLVCKEQAGLAVRLLKLLLYIKHNCNRMKTFSAGMSNCCILGPNWLFNFTERSIHWIRYIIEGINEKVYRVCADSGDITTMHSSGGNSTAFLLLVSETRKRGNGVSHLTNKRF